MSGIETKTTNSFEKILNTGSTYVDKTTPILNIFKNNQSFIHLLAPDGFGKTLLVDTLDSIFSAKKQNFKNLDIFYSSYNWKYYQTFKLDFSDCKISDNFSTVKYLCSKIENEILKSNLGIDIRILQNYSKTLSDPREVLEYYLDTLFIRISSDNSPIVILIDNYDTFTLSALSSDIDYNLYQNTVEIFSLFYKKLFDNKKYIHFLIITGILKLDFFNDFYSQKLIEPIDQTKNFNCLLGYSSKEISTYFKGLFKIISSSLNLDQKSFLKSMSLWYGGYGLVEQRLFHPKMINLLFKEDASFNYYSGLREIGYSHNIIKNSLIKNHLLSIDPYILNGVLDFSTNNSISIPNPNITSLLFGLGLLSIKKENSYTNGTRISYLGITNKYSRLILDNYISESIFNNSQKLKSTLALSIIMYLQEHNIKALIDKMSLLLKEIKFSNFYDLKNTFLYGLYYLLEKIDSIETNIFNLNQETYLIVSFSNQKFVLTLSQDDASLTPKSYRDSIDNFKTILKTNTKKYSSKNSFTKFTTIYVDDSNLQIKDIKLDEIPY